MTDQSAMDVTPRILQSVQTYGSSDYTNPAYSSSNRSLNYHEGGSIQRPEKDGVTVIPYTLKFEDTVGLFGKENHFVRIDVKVDKSIALACFAETGWQCATITLTAVEVDNTYLTEIIDPNKDLSTVNTYEPAVITADTLPNYAEAVLSVDLENLKTGNQYIDSWFDVRLYTRNRKEHPYNKMYVHLNDVFYIGFHARNTKRLPYNVTCEVGQQYIPIELLEDERYLNR